MKKYTGGFTFTKAKRRTEGFTLIELLVVISILGILLALSIFGMQGAREASRDGKRKADLEQIRSGLEMYRADCNAYPATAAFPAVGASLKGSGSPAATCLVSNIYISSVPGDPVSTSRIYRYSSTGPTYEICASLEQGSGSVTCGGSSNCAPAGYTATCNYKVTSP